MNDFLEIDKMMFYGFEIEPEAAAEAAEEVQEEAAEDFLDPRRAFADFVGEIETSGAWPDADSLVGREVFRPPVQPHPMPTVPPRPPAVTPHPMPTVPPRPPVVAPHPMPTVPPRPPATVPHPRPPHHSGSAPRFAPPAYTPRHVPGLRAVDAGAISGCLYSFTYLWLNNRQQFWFFPTFVGRRSVAGYRWMHNNWVYMGFDLRMVDSFFCGGR